MTSRSRQILLLVMILLLIGAGLLLWRGGDGSLEIRSQSAHLEAPLFELPDDKGKLVKLADFAGRAALVHFWASWCPPCLEETPNFVKLATDMNGSGIAFLAVSIDESWKDAEKILNPAAIPSDLVSLLDLSKKLPERFGTYQYPETYLLNREHRILMKWVGPQDWANASMRAEIERAAAPVAAN